MRKRERRLPRLVLLPHSCDSTVDLWIGFGVGTNYLELVLDNMIFGIITININNTVYDHVHNKRE